MMKITITKMTLSIFLLSILLLLTVVTTAFSIVGYQNVQAFKIQGEGFGNNGARFKSFVICPDGRKHFFDGGSHLQFSAATNKASRFGNISGEFTIKYYDGLGKPEYETGIFSNGVLSKSSYLLRGIEASNTVCNNTSKVVIIFSGLCGDNVNINYGSEDGRMLSASTLPNSIQEVSSPSFFGSNVICTNG